MSESHSNQGQRDVPAAPAGGLGQEGRTCSATCGAESSDTCFILKRCMEVGLVTQRSKSEGRTCSANWEAGLSDTKNTMRCPVYLRAFLASISACRAANARGSRQRKEKTRPAKRRPCALRRGSLTSKLVGVSPKEALGLPADPKAHKGACSSTADRKHEWSGMRSRAPAQQPNMHTFTHAHTPACPSQLLQAVTPKRGCTFSASWTILVCIKGHTDRAEMLAPIHTCTSAHNNPTKEHVPFMSLHPQGIRGGLHPLHYICSCAPTIKYLSQKYTSLRNPHGEHTPLMPH
eukprot:scaffold15084_cov21-Tisochrysis_lutea.AAC.2